MDLENLAHSMNVHLHGPGEWDWCYGDGDVCDDCEDTVFRPSEVVTNTYTFDTVCIPCAVKRCAAAREDAI